MSKTCVVVGVGPGIGRSVARRFATEGFPVVMMARDADAVAKFEREIPNSRGVAVDAADDEALRSAIRSAGPASVLVYNVSAGHPGGACGLPASDAMADFRVNIMGLLAAVQECVPRMREAGRGTILITGGGLALTPMSALASLSMGKAAQRSLAFSLAGELEPAGIHVATVTVCGFVKPGTHFDPDRIADEYWRLHTQDASGFEREVVYR